MSYSDEKIAKWASDLQHRDDGSFESERISERAFEIGLRMDAGERFEAQFGISCFDLNGLQKTLPQVDDIHALGNLAFSQWRGITHWGFIGEEERTFLILTLQRIIELNNKQHPFENGPSK